MTHIDLATVDVDGAVREAGAATGGDTRAQFFRKAAISGGAAISAGGFLGMLPALADARPSKKQDLTPICFSPKRTSRLLHQRRWSGSTRLWNCTGSPRSPSMLLLATPFWTL